MRRRWLAVLLAVSLLAGTGTATSTLTIDADHPLTDQAAITEYEREGVVTGSLTRLQLTITIADDHEAANISGAYVDVNKRYLCLDYREQLDRTLRIYIPAAYWRPRVNDHLESLTGGPAATLTPVENGSYTAVTVHFEGPRRVCYPVGRAPGLYFGGKRGLRDVIANATGFTLPSFGGEASWHYVQRTDFVNGTAHIPAGESATIQWTHDPVVGNGSADWRPVPKCEGDDDPVCRQAAGNGTVLISQESLTVRWVRSPNPGADIRAAVNGAMAAVGRIISKIDNALGGLFN